MIVDNPGTLDQIEIQEHEHHALAALSGYRATGGNP